MPCYLNVLSQKKSVDLTSVDHFSIISVMHMTRFCPFCHPFFCVSSDMTSPPLHTGDVMDILKHERTSVGAMLPGVSCFMPYICRGATSWILNSRDEQLGQIPHAMLSNCSLSQKKSIGFFHTQKNSEKTQKNSEEKYGHRWIIFQSSQSCT